MMACNDIGLQSMQPRREREKETALASELQGRVIFFACVSGYESSHLGRSEPPSSPPRHQWVQNPVGLERSNQQLVGMRNVMKTSKTLAPTRKKGRSGGGSGAGSGEGGREGGARGVESSAATENYFVK